MRWSRLVVLFAIAATACNAITGASDLTADLCSDCGEDASVAPVDAMTTDHAMPEGKDAGADSAFDGPTFCVGLVLYASYENDVKSDVGSSPLATKASIVSGGKYGSGLQALGTATSVYYPMGVDGGAPYPDKAGTIAFWFRSSLAFGANADRIFAKPVVDQTASVNETAPQIRFDLSSELLGITNQNPDAGYASAGIPSPRGGLPPGWNPTDFNHLVGTWNRDPASLRFWLNGGTQPSTFSESTMAWTPQVMSPTGYLRLSSSVSPVEGTYDELTVWSRELDANEVGALYGSKVSIAEACGL